MKKSLLLSVSVSILAFISASCGSTGAKNDAADSIARTDSIRMADSLAQIEADSIARAELVARTDSIAKASAENAAKRDKSIDKDLDDIEEINNFLASDNPSQVWHAYDAAQEAVNELKKKVNRMTPDQKARFNKLKKQYD